MKALPDPPTADRWPLPRVLILNLAGAFVGLMIDIRVEHVDAVRERSVAWLPIIYAGVMTVACLLAAIFWTRLARRIMIPLFLLAFGVGGTGFYLHNHGDLKSVVKASWIAWTARGTNHAGEPPQVAPLAFAGLGALGLLASVNRFNRKDHNDIDTESWVRFSGRNRSATDDTRQFDEHAQY